MFPVELGHGGQEDQCHEPNEPRRHNPTTQHGQELINGQKQNKRYQKLKIVPGDPEILVDAHLAGLEQEGHHVPFS